MSDTPSDTSDAPADATDTAPDSASNSGVDVEQALDDLDALLNSASFEDPVTDEPAEAKAPAAVAAPPAAKPNTPAPPTRAAPPSPATEVPALDVGNVNLPQFDKILQEAQVSGIELLRDVKLDVTIELGRSRMLVEDVLKLVEGSVVELDKLAGDPVDVYVNDRLVARGEVLVLNENFCIRVSEILTHNVEEEA